MAKQQWAAELASLFQEQFEQGMASPNPLPAAAEAAHGLGSSSSSSSRQLHALLSPQVQQAGCSTLLVPTSTAAAGAAAGPGDSNQRLLLADPAVTAEPFKQLLLEDIAALRDYGSRCLVDALCGMRAACDLPLWAAGRRQEAVQGGHHCSSSSDGSSNEAAVKLQSLAAAAALEGTAGNDSYRQLLWDVLQALKPSVVPWYSALAKQQQQQQQQQSCVEDEGLNAAAADLCGDVATASSEHKPDGSDQSAAAAAAPSIADQTLPELWEAVCGSIACDVIVVPPAVRDLLGNGWAGGQGRLQQQQQQQQQQHNGHTNKSSSSSSRSRNGDETAAAAAAAAHMMVVQYARALRSHNLKVSQHG
jgi:hypothetical protein